ncbi:sulfurtransferase [Mangrovibacter sp. MFB070]|uniref:sulfurtransferase n=1 Tax=Mangrovibacter sp. MFB070 TaxID=1224318 RepID=UPI000AA592AD|nr:rhodanese-like domain-containing protein [Mangrovibacter sp. MFB070]
MYCPFTSVSAHSGVMIDTRQSAFYNGWPQEAGGTQGHEPGAVNLNVSWLAVMGNNQLCYWLGSQNIRPDTPVALCGTQPGNEQVALRLKQCGINNLYYLNDAFQVPERLHTLAKFPSLVYPHWLVALQHGSPELFAAPQTNWVLLEAGFDTASEYAKGHIPGATFLDTREVEGGPLWNKLPDAQLMEMLRQQGIEPDTTVILYSRGDCAAARVAVILLYAGVKDVRLLDGGWHSWQQAGLPVETGTRNKPAPLQTMPAFTPDTALFVDQSQVSAWRSQSAVTLVSVRSLAEHRGKTSGYTYIEAAGDIPGAHWGHAGEHNGSVQDFLNPDGTMIRADALAALWAGEGIFPRQKVVFYCGTGWRASAALFYARAMGWQDIALYDGGWYEWSRQTTHSI